MRKTFIFLPKSGSTDTWCLRFLAKNRRHQVSPGMVFLKFQNNKSNLNYLFSHNIYQFSFHKNNLNNFFAVYPFFNFLAAKS